MAELTLQERLRQTYTMLDNATTAGDQEAVNDIKQRQQKLLALNDEQRRTEYPNYSQVSDTLVGGAQGFTAGFVDEAYGAVSTVPAVLGFGGGEGESYTQNIENTYQMNRDIVRERPTTWGPELVGAVAGPGKYFKGIATAKDLSLVQKGKRLFEEGALFGGVEGYGSSESESAVGDVINTGIGVIEGGLMNVGFGSLIGVAPAVWQAGKGLWNKLNETDLNKAMRSVGEAVRASGMSTDQVMQRLQELGPVSTLADITDALRLKAVVATKKSEDAMTSTLDFLKDRQSTSSNRIQGYLNDAGEVPSGTSYRGEKNRVQQERSAAGDKNYAFMTEAADIPMTPELQSFLGTPYIQRILAGPTGLENAFRSKNRLAADSPNVFEQDNVPWQAMDELKKRIDDEIGASRSPINPNASQRGAGRIYKDLKDELVGYMDSLDARYKNARDVHATKSKVLEAGESGETIATKRGSGLLDELDEIDTSQMTPDELRMFRQGTATTLGEKLPPGPTANKAGRLMQEDVEPVLDVLATGPEARGRLGEQIAGEAEMHKTYRLIDPSLDSKTSAVQLATEGADAGETAVRAGTAGLTGGTSEAFTIVRNAMSEFGVSSGQADNMARVLINPNVTRAEVEALMEAGIPREAVDEMLQILQNSSSMAPLRTGLLSTWMDPTNE